MLWIEIVVLQWIMDLNLQFHSLRIKLRVSNCLETNHAIMRCAPTYCSLAGTSHKLFSCDVIASDRDGGTYLV